MSLTKQLMTMIGIGTAAAGAAYLYPKVTAAVEKMQVGSKRVPIAVPGYQSSASVGLNPSQTQSNPMTATVLVTSDWTR